MLCMTNQSESPMKKFIWLTPLLFALNVVFAGCDERGRQPVAGRAPSPSTAPSTARLSDSELQKAVRAKLETDAQLKEDFEHRPRVFSQLCGNSYFRYPCLKNFFFKSPITNDLEATKAYTTPFKRPSTQSPVSDLAIRRSVHVDLPTDDQPKEQQLSCLGARQRALRLHSAAELPVEPLNALVVRSDFHWLLGKL